MDIESILHYCQQLKGTTEHFPFDANTLVFKVMGKMYALIDVENPTGINVKCDPETAIDLRERYACVIPGYHMSKKHWNTIQLNGEMDNKELESWILHSYELVVSSLPKKLQHELSL